MWTRCYGRLTYDASQRAHTHRTIRDAASLEEYALAREDAGVDHTDRPRSVIGLDRVAYTVYRGREDQPQLQALKVFVEKPQTRHPQAGHMLHSEYGFAKRGTLLGAVGEWRTWIVLM